MARFDVIGVPLRGRDIEWGNGEAGRGDEGKGSRGRWGQGVR